MLTKVNKEFKAIMLNGTYVTTNDNKYHAHNSRSKCKQRQKKAAAAKWNGKRRGVTKTERGEQIKTNRACVHQMTIHGIAFLSHWSLAKGAHLKCRKGQRINVHNIKPTTVDELEYAFSENKIKSCTL